MKAIHLDLISSTKAEETLRGFDKHELSASHKEATDRFIVIPESSAGDIGKLLSES